MSYRESKRDERARDVLARRARAVLREAGAFLFYRHDVKTFSHAAGTVRFGDDARSAPLDRWCRFRGLPNLYVVDASIMPTSGTVNPSLTIATNACGSRPVSRGMRGREGRVSEPRLRLAVLGCGQAALLAARALRELRGVSCAYASREPERAARFGQKLGGRAFGSYEEALASPDVDAVLVATPPASHFDLALRALECGKSVVLEKPPTLDTGELDALGTAARLAGRRVMVARTTSQAARSGSAGAHRRGRWRASVRAVNAHQGAAAAGGVATELRRRRALQGGIPGGFPREPRPRVESVEGFPDRRERNGGVTSGWPVSLLDRRRRHAFVSLETPSACAGWLRVWYAGGASPSIERLSGDRGDA